MIPFELLAVTRQSAAQDFYALVHKVLVLRGVPGPPACIQMLGLGCCTMEIIPCNADAGEARGMRAVKELTLGAVEHFCCTAVFLHLGGREYVLIRWHPSNSQIIDSMQ